MRHGLGLLGVTLLLAASAGAQGPAGVGGTGGAGPRSAPVTFSSSDDTPWQLSLGYQYNKINLLGTPFNTNGLSVDAARYFGRWIGVEGQAGFGFGNTAMTTSPPNLSAKSVFIGAGPRLVWRNRSRIEPWAHLVVGLQHFRFTQTVGVLGNNSALAGAAGGGIDFRLGTHTAFRVEADAIGSRFFSTDQRHFQGIGGLVFNF